MPVKNYENSKFAKMATDLYNEAESYILSKGLPVRSERNKTQTDAEKYATLLALRIKHFLKPLPPGKDYPYKIELQQKLQALIDKNTPSCSYNTPLKVESLKELLNRLETFCLKHKRYPTNIQNPKTSEEKDEVDLALKLEWMLNCSLKRSPAENENDLRFAVQKKIQLFKNIFFDFFVTEDYIRFLSDTIKQFVKDAGCYMETSRLRNSNQVALYNLGQTIISNSCISPELKDMISSVRSNTIKSKFYFIDIKTRRTDLSVEERNLMVMKLRNKNETIAGLLLDKINSYLPMKGLDAFIEYFGAVPKQDSKIELERFVSKKTTEILTAQNRYLNPEKAKIRRLSSKYPPKTDEEISSMLTL